MRSALVGNRGTGSTNASTTAYGGFTLGFNRLANETTEALRQIPVRTPGTFSRMWLLILTNSRGASTYRIRVNGADGNQTVSIAASFTGYAEDLTNTDTVTAGQLVGYRVTTGAGGTAFVDRAAGAAFEASDTTKCVTLMGAGSGGSWNLSTASVTVFAPAGAEGNSTATEADAQYKMMAPAVAANLSVYVSANGRTTTTTIRSRVNGADGNMVISLAGSSAAGQYEDLVNTDALAAGDLLCYSIATGTGAGTLTLYSTKVELASDRYCGFANCGAPINSGATRVAAGGTRYWSLGGSSNAGQTSTEADQQSRAMLDTGALFSQASIYVSTNGVTNTTTVTLRKNGAATAISVSIPGGTPGRFEDTVNTATVTTGESDTFNWQIVAGSGGTDIYVSSYGIRYTMPTPQSVDGALGFTGAIARQTVRSLSGAVGFAGALARARLRAVAGAVSFSGGIARRLGKACAGVLSWAGALVSAGGNVVRAFVVAAATRVGYKRLGSN